MTTVKKTTKAQMFRMAAREEEYQAEEIREAIDGLFEALGIATKMNVVEICHDIRKLGRNEKVSLPEEDATGTGEQDKSTPEISLPEEKSSSGEEALFSDIPEKTAEGATRLSGRKKITAQAAIQYIAENCTRYDLSLDMVADEFNITPTYLCRIIKQQMGISYKEYLTGLRMDAAKKMLREEDASVADVCQRIGYTNVSHFIKVFQKSEGITPARYRDETSE